MITIDIDTGGTMTDALVTDGDKRRCIKVDTTPHDYTVSFQNCLIEAAKLYGDDSVEEFLRRVALIRWSSTITTNVIAERRGAKIGLLVSAGHQEDLYGNGRSIVVDELVASDNVIGLSDEPSAEDVLMAVKNLLESGVRRICVSLRGSFPDGEAERAIKEVIEDPYPDHIIGSVPVLLGSDMAQIHHDQTRAHYSLLNAYTHTKLAASLFKAEDVLRDAHRWPGALLIGHTNGGVARVGKTKAVDTIESGPVFGTFGGAYMAREYGLGTVVCFDVGGTTTKASIVKDGEPLFQRGGELMEIPVQTSFAMVRSAPIGGGSVARVRGGNVSLGPDSMGAAPGPACYGLGGTQATITDALLVLGYLDPTRFLGGRRHLDVEQSRKAIDESVARPLHVSVEQGAALIRDEAVSVMANLIAATLEEGGLSAEGGTLFAYGGNGPMFGAFVADILRLSTVYVFDLGPIFSAFGSAQSDVVHTYERGIGAALKDESVTAAAGEIHRQAVRDLESSGFDPRKAEFRYELEFDGADGVGAARFEVQGQPGDDWVALAAAALAKSGLAKDGTIILLRLSSRYVIGVQPLHKREPSSGSTNVVSREVVFDGHAVRAPVYVWEQLSIGDKIDGPAIINGATLTCPVPPGWRLDVDPYGNGRLEKP